MKYRHSFHAGNFADVFKHVALVATLDRLTQKDRPLFYLETHAGRGRYDLAAQAGPGEAALGIEKLAALPTVASWPAPLRRYLVLVREFGTTTVGRLRWYPGSPCIAMHLLRPDDRAALCDLLPEEADALRHEFSRDARVAVHCRDGFEALRALLPPQEVRGLVLIDPPYESQESDLEQVADALTELATRWPQGVLMAWYPIKQAAMSGRFHRRLRQSGVKRVLAAELAVHPEDSRAGLNGSGLVFVNPPWRLDQDLRAILPLLHRELSPEGRGGTSVNWLVGE